MGFIEGLCITIEIIIIFRKMLFQQSLIVLSTSRFFILVVGLKIYIVLCSVMDSNNSNTSDYLAFIFAKFIIFLIILYFRKRVCCCNNNDNNDRLCCNNNDDNEELIRTEGYYNFFYTN